MSQTQSLQALTFITNMVKIPPLKAVSLFNSTTLQGTLWSHILFILHSSLSLSPLDENRVPFKSKPSYKTSSL
ncbi:hypothetical protein QYF36_010730 [Acer negundo]|nr:hypothetical protein QYF36_010730 [Acer negundo]